MIKEIRRRAYKTSDGQVFMYKHDAEKHQEHLTYVAAKQKEEVLVFNLYRKLNPTFPATFTSSTGYKQALKDVIKHFNLQPKEI